MCNILEFLCYYGPIYCTSVLYLIQNDVYHIVVEGSGGHFNPGINEGNVKNDCTQTKNYIIHI